jgi:hypothetical protein
MNIPHNSDACLSNPVVQQKRTKPTVTENTDSPKLPAPQPSLALQQLDRLVGTWQVTGGAEGQVTYRWLEGGFFLLQQIDLFHQGHRIQAIEVIGHAHPFGEEPSAAITSRIYDNAGNTFDYEYELEGDVLTIWGGGKGSSAYYRATFDETGTILTGGWVYPGGGGYQTITTKVTPVA